MNNGIHVSFSILVSLGYMPRSEIAGSYGGFIPSFLRNLHTVFLEKAMATHSSTLAWKIPRTEEPDRLQSLGSLRVGHDWATSLSLSCTREGNGNPLQYSCLENPRDGGAWWAAVYGVTQSWTRLERFSSSSSSSILSSIVAISIYIPTNSAKAYPILHTLSSTYCL